MRKHKHERRETKIFGIDDFVVGMIGGGLIDAISGHNANQQNVELANANRAFNKEHAMNAHQWEVQDLMKAGLNPMLSFRGSGAPLNSSAPGQVEPLTRNSSEKITSALAAKMQASGITAGIEKTQAEKKLADQNTITSAAEARKRNIEALILEGYGGEELKAKIRLMDQQRLTSATEADRNTQAITESQKHIEKMDAEMEGIASNIKLQGMETALKKAQAEGAMVETRLAQRTFYEVMEGIKDGNLIKKYEAQEKALGAKAAQAAWRVWLAEKGLTITQIENILGALPNVAFVYPMKNITTINNGGKK